MSRTAYVYILASKKKGTLYTGVTSNLERHLYEHKHHLLEGFTSKYDVTRLVWFLQGEDILRRSNWRRRSRTAAGNGRLTSSKKPIRTGMTLPRNGWIPRLRFAPRGMTLRKRQVR